MVVFHSGDEYVMQLIIETVIMIDVNAFLEHTHIYMFCMLCTKKKMLFHQCDLQEMTCIVFDINYFRKYTNICWEVIILQCAIQLKYNSTTFYYKMLVHHLTVSLFYHFRWICFTQGLWQ